jgi:hypothetical protein
MRIFAAADAIASRLRLIAIVFLLILTLPTQVRVQRTDANLENPGTDGTFPSSRKISDGPEVS